MFVQWYAKPQAYERNRSKRASWRNICCLAVIVSAAAKEKTVPQHLHRYLISVSRRYHEDNYERIDTTGKDATSMLEDAILLSVAMLLLCDFDHAHPLSLVEDKQLEAKQSSFSWGRMIAEIKKQSKCLLGCSERGKWHNIRQKQLLYRRLAYM